MAESRDANREAPRGDTDRQTACVFTSRRRSAMSSHFDLTSVFWLNEVEGQLPCATLKSTPPRFATEHYKMDSMKEKVSR